jgi:protein-L-isoaspartate(D-aspartate) O-methyltransferase
MPAGPLNPKIARSRLANSLREKGIHDTRVLDAIGAVPRHRFVDTGFENQAYDDVALPIGYGQTISQPYVVARMTELLRLQRDEKILEIGTGSGYQAAMLAHFSKRVYTIERNETLARKAKQTLQQLGYVNVVCKNGDGTRGWAAYAPFDRIIVTAGAPCVPDQLQKQLATGGRLVIPAGDRSMQTIEIYDKHDDGHVEKTEGDHVVFVPLVGQNGWQE